MPRAPRPDPSPAPAPPPLPAAAGRPRPAPPLELAGLPHDWLDALAVNDQGPGRSLWLCSMRGHAFALHHADTGEEVRSDSVPVWAGSREEAWALFLGEGGRGPGSPGIYRTTHQIHAEPA